MGHYLLMKNWFIKFEEKPKGDGALINGGFFVLSPKVIKLIEDDFTIWEQNPLRRISF